MVASRFVALEIANGAHFVGLALDVYLIRLHGLLNAFADFIKSGVDSGFSDAGGRGLLGGDKQVIEGGVEANGEGAVDKQAFDMGAEVDFDDVALLHHLLVSRVR